MNAQEHALDIETRLMEDIRNTLAQHGIKPPFIDRAWIEGMVEDLARDGMHHVEHLLTAVKWDE